MNHLPLRRWAFSAPIFAALLAALLTGTAAAQQLALGGLDPVLLTQGQQTDGREDVTATAGRYLYRFATTASRDRFRADVDRYEIQFDGGCARMGPLSGVGDPDRFAVYQGRIYIFASDACREGFLKRAELFFDPDTDAPEPTENEAQRGRELLQRTVAAHGGKERLQQLTTYRHQRTMTKGDTTQELRMFVQFPDHVRLDHDYIQPGQTWRYTKVLAPKSAFFVDDGQVRPMHASARRELERTLLCEPVFALRAALARDVVVRHGGKAARDGNVIEDLELWIDGCTTTFGIGADGLIRTAQYRGRGPQLWFAPMTRVFSDYVERDGVKVPTTVAISSDGASVGPAEQRLDIELGGELPDGLFARPR